MTGRSVLLRQVSGIGLAALLLAAPASADAWQPYEAGKLALEREDWAAAEAEFREAIEEEPQERKRKRRKLSFHRYLPHFYLGYALLEQGRYPEALAELEVSERQGAIKDLAEHSRLARYRERCQDFLSECQRLAEEGRREVNAAFQAVGALAARGKDAALSAYWNATRLPWAVTLSAENDRAPIEIEWLAVERSLATRSADAEDPLEEAQRHLDEGQEACDLEVISDATQKAEKVRQQLIEADQAAERVQDTVEKWAAALRGRIERSVVEADRELLGNRCPEPLPTRLAAAKADLERIKEKRTDNIAWPDLLEALAKELDQTLEAFRTAAAGPPGLLADAVRGRMVGDHEHVIRRLENASFEDPKARARGHLLLAASRFALYRLGGERDSSLLLSAREDVARCRDLLGGKAGPAASLYSPAFLEFFLSGD